MSTPGSHASAVPVTPHALRGDGIWPSSEFSPATTFSPFDSSHFEAPDLARKVKDITRSPPFVNETTIGHHLLVRNEPFRTLTTGLRLPNLSLEGRVSAVHLRAADIQRSTLLTAQELSPYRAILVRHLETHGFVILCFHDSRDTMKVYNKLLISSVRFNRALGPVSLQCTAIHKDVVRAVRPAPSLHALTPDRRYCRRLLRESLERLEPLHRCYSERRCYGCRG